MPAKKKKVARVGGKTSAPKARRVSVAPAPRRTVDPGWAWDDRLPLAQAKQIGSTIYVSGQIAYDADGKLVGDVDPAAMQAHAGAFTPVPGGVGPLTIAMLMTNAVNLAEQHLCSG